MKKRTYTILMIYSLIYFICIVLASRMLIQFSSSLFGWIGPLCGLDAEITNYGKDILIQLRHANITSPWIVALGTAVLSSFGCFHWVKKNYRALIGISIILSVPFILGAVMLTEVNGILTGKLVSHLLTLL